MQSIEEISYRSTQMKTMCQKQVYVYWLFVYTLKDTEALANSTIIWIVSARHERWMPSAVLFDKPDEGSEFMGLNLVSPAVERPLRRALISRSKTQAYIPQFPCVNQHIRLP